MQHIYSDLDPARFKVFHVRNFFFAKGDFMHIHMMRNRKVLKEIRLLEEKCRCLHLTSLVKWKGCIIGLEIYVRSFKRSENMSSSPPNTIYKETGLYQDGIAFSFMLKFLSLLVF